MSKRLEPWVVFGVGAVVAGLGAWLYAWWGTGSRRIGTLWRRFS